MKIKGNTVGTTMPRANWDQEDPKKADYIKGRDKVNKAIADAQTAADEAQTAADNAQTAADDAQTAADNAQTAADDAQTAADEAKTATDNHAADVENPHGVTPAQIGAQAQHQNTVVTLSADGWIDNRQIVLVSGLCKDDTVIATPDAESHNHYVECGVKPLAKSAGAITYVCEDVPDVDLTINVTILPAGGSGSTTGGGSANSGGSGENQTGSVALPAGGKAGQFLRKKSDADGDVEWADFEIPEQYGLISYDQDRTITIT